MKYGDFRHWAINHYDQLAYVYVFLFSVAIFFRPYTAPGQLLIIDSILYMEIASHVLDGSFWSKFLTGDPTLYWYWPMGYPIILGLIGKILSVDIFFSGRILNLMAYLITVFSIKRIFREKWSFYIFVCGSASFLGLFTHTLTEAIFIAFGFLGLSQVLKEGRQTWIAILSFIMMGLIRYIGVFTIVFLGIYFGFVKKIKWLSAFFAVGVLLFAYIQIEWLLTNQLPTSIISNTPKVDKLRLLQQALSTIFGTLSFFEFDHWGGIVGKILFIIGLAPFVGTVLVWRNNGKKTNRLKVEDKSFVLMLFGLSYMLLFFFVLFGLGS